MRSLRQRGSPRHRQSFPGSRPSNCWNVYADRGIRLAISGRKKRACCSKIIRRERALLCPPALTFFRTGLRTGEVLGLHGSDLNVHRRSIYVQRDWSRGIHTQELQGPRVDMSQGLAQALTEWIELPDPEAAAAGTQRLKSSFQETLAEPGGSQVIWRRIGCGTHCGFPWWRERTATTGYKQCPTYLCKPGHGSITITCDIYGQLIPGGTDKRSTSRIRYKSVLEP